MKNFTIRFWMWAAGQANGGCRIPAGRGKKEAETLCVLRLFRRNALKPGGAFISFENFAPFSQEGERLSLDRWNAYQINQGRSREECKKHLGRYNKNYFPITMMEHLNLMKNCGFKAAEVLWGSYMQMGILGIK